MKVQFLPVQVETPGFIVYFGAISDHNNYLSELCVPPNITLCRYINIFKY